MKRSSIFFGVLFNILLTVNLYADVMQQTIHFQGFLTDSNDVAVMDNVYTMTFSLWDNSDNENASAANFGKKPNRFRFQEVFIVPILEKPTLFHTP